MAFGVKAFVKNPVPVKTMVFEAIDKLVNTGIDESVYSY